ncbi:MAG: tyrosine--tRNA ligase [Saprospiraceae bacterium]|nr:tyrosine--tRNA ligase [Saprospiraceae bacterium]
MNFVEELRWRGMLHDMTPGTEEIIGKEKITGYIGFDPTAPSMTIGNYVQLMLLKLFQKHGHNPIVLMGGATGRIGDPSMRDTERELKSYDELDRNLSFQVEQCHKLLAFEGVDNPAILRNNLDFYKNMNVLDFLRDVGKNLTVNYMLAKDSVKKRLETGLSFTEFSYQLIQGYDFQVLLEQDNCVLQMGGSDQWGNITSGTEVIRRNLGTKVYALTTPLLMKADGTKFGKSTEGNLWLDPNLTSPYQFYQFWLNADDRDIEKYVRYFSMKPHEEMERIIELSKENPREAKRLIAEELTIAIHSQEDYEQVLKVSELIFNPSLDHEFLKNLSHTDWNNLKNEIPSFGLNSEFGPQILDLLSQDAPVFTSKAEARRAIQQNALSINKVKVTDPNHTSNDIEWYEDKYILVENGKKNKFILYRS